MTATRSLPDTTPETVIGRTRHTNLSVAELYEHAVRADEGLIAAGGSLVVRTGKHTGRSPMDKYLVDEPGSHDGVWWTGFNQPISERRYEALRQRIVDHLSTRDVFVRDCFVGAHPAHRRSVRAYTESAWAGIFCNNLFIRPTAAQLEGLRAQLHHHRRALIPRRSPP